MFVRQLLQREVPQRITQSWFTTVVCLPALHAANAVLRAYGQDDG